MQERVASAVSASIETINRRVNALGTAESTVVRQGRDRILIQYPGLTDTTQLKELIGKTAKLTFHSVHPTVSAEEAKATRVPLGYKIYESAERDDAGPAATCSPRRRWCRATISSMRSRASISRRTSRSSRSASTSPARASSAPSPRTTST